MAFFRLQEPNLKIHINKFSMPPKWTGSDDQRFSWRAKVCESKISQNSINLSRKESLMSRRQSIDPVRLNIKQAERITAKKENYIRKPPEYLITGTAMSPLIGTNHTSRSAVKNNVKIMRKRKEAKKTISNTLLQLPHVDVLIKCPLLDAIESGNYITTKSKPTNKQKIVKTEQTSKPKMERSKSEMSTRGCKYRSHNVRPKTQMQSTEVLESPVTIYQSYFDREKNEVNYNQIARDEKVRSWIEYNKFNSSYAINDINYAWSDKI